MDNQGFESDLTTTEENGGYINDASEIDKPGEVNIDIGETSATSKEEERKVIVNDIQATNVEIQANKDEIQQVKTDNDNKNNNANDSFNDECSAGIENERKENEAYERKQIGGFINDIKDEVNITNTDNGYIVGNDLKKNNIRLLSQGDNEVIDNQYVTNNNDGALTTNEVILDPSSLLTGKEIMNVYMFRYFTLHIHISLWPFFLHMYSNHG